MPNHWVAGFNGHQVNFLITKALDLAEDAEKCANNIKNDHIESRWELKNDFLIKRDKWLEKAIEVEEAGGLS